MTSLPETVFVLLSQQGAVSPDVVEPDVPLLCGDSERRKNDATKRRERHRRRHRIRFLSLHLYWRRSKTFRD